VLGSWFPGLKWARAAGADLEDLRVGEAVHLAERGVRGEAISTRVDLADDEIDDFAPLGVRRRLGQVQRETGAECISECARVASRLGAKPSWPLRASNSH